MDRERLLQLLTRVRDRTLGAEEAAEVLAHFPYSDGEDLKLDLQRTVRTGFPEAIFGEGKTPEQIERAVERLSSNGGRVLATRLDPPVGEELARRWPEGTWHPRARVFEIGRERADDPTSGLVVVVAAGTTDGPVAEEAAITARVSGARVETIVDVGVAGLHRLLAVREKLVAAEVVIVVAGMDAALASVVGGLVPGLVIAVPTSVGYGATFGGVTALCSMLVSCAPGVLVCNIDNGFGAGIAAARVVRANVRSSGDAPRLRMREAVE